MSDEQYYAALSLIDRLGNRGVTLDQYLRELGDNDLSLTIGQPPLRYASDDTSPKTLLTRIVNAIHDLSDGLKEIGLG